MNKILSIISPALPPTINGLGDYSIRIGEALNNEFDNIYYFSSEYSSNSRKKIFHFNNSPKLLFNLINELKTTHILLNYSGYGYNSKGIPFWISNFIKKIKLEGIIVSVFFHELSASGHFLKPIYWLGLIQKKVFQNIYKESNYVFCSNSIVKKIIDESTPDQGYKCFNIGMISNVPDPLIPIVWATKKKSVVVFGTKGRRSSIFKNYSVWLPVLIELDVNEIIDIGEDIDEPYPNISIPIYKKGVLTIDAIASNIHDASYGLIDYPFHLLGKSGVFACYAAYGIIPLCFQTNAREIAVDGLKVSVHFIDINIGVSDDIKDFSRIGENLNNWYLENNSIKVHSKKMIDILNSTL